MMKSTGGTWVRIVHYHRKDFAFQPFLIITDLPSLTPRKTLCLDTRINLPIPTTDSSDLRPTYGAEIDRR